MERKISVDDVRKAVDQAYEDFKSDRTGTPNPDVQTPDADALGIVVALTDGRVIKKGDTAVPSVMGALNKLALATVLLTQNSPEELVKKHYAGCCCKSKCPKPQIGISAHGLRMVSAVVPQGDRDGKMAVISQTLEGLVGSAPVLDDKFYESLRAAQAAEKAVDKVAEAGYTLYDDTEASLDVLDRLTALQLTAEQAAVMGATIAADGRNPLTGDIVFDGSIAASVVTVTALGGPHHEKRAFALEVGLPVKRGRAGLLVALLPGFGAIATYAPRLDDNGVSVKGRKALTQIARSLGLNIYASARVRVE